MKAGHSMIRIFLLVGMVGIFLLCGPSALMAAEESLIDVSGSYRLRFEHQEDSFRPGTSGTDQMLVSLLLLSAKASGEHWFGEVELEDARAWLDDAGSPLGTDDVNTLEPLQAYAGWRQSSGENQSLAVRAGRMTLDIAGRRQIGRSVYPNTKNSFTGVHSDWRHNAWRAQAFTIMPMNRLPATLADLDDNKQDLDRQYSGIRLTGASLSYAAPGALPDMDAFLFRFTEDDQRDLATRNRNFNVAGMRIVKPATPGQWLYEVELMLQHGTVRGSAAPADVRDLEHRASMLHGRIGFQFENAWASRVYGTFDYASGDESPLDAYSNRFDSLFGPLQGDFGGTGIYGPLTRSNLFAPGLSWEYRASPRVSGFVNYKAMWLAADRDAFSASAVRDSSGRSGDYAGQHIDTRMVITLIDGMQLQLGGAFLLKGEFLKDAPNAPDSGDTVYWYSQMTYQF
jgi:hypothetical protein